LGCTSTRCSRLSSGYPGERLFPKKRNGPRINTALLFGRRHPLFFLPESARGRVARAVEALRGRAANFGRGDFAGVGFAPLPSDDDFSAAIEMTAVRVEVAGEEGVDGDEDEEALEEERRVLSLPPGTSLSVRGLSKRYPGSDRAALAPLWLAVQEKSCFGRAPSLKTRNDKRAD